MARIAGIDLPRDKRIEIALTYIFGDSDLFRDRRKPGYQSKRLDGR